jgi:hypothetical protein
MEFKMIANFFTKMANICSSAIIFAKPIHKQKKFEIINKMKKMNYN